MKLQSREWEDRIIDASRRMRYSSAVVSYSYPRSSALLCGWAVKRAVKTYKPQSRRATLSFAENVFRLGWNRE
jgi:hypothetical protein